jgi:hypothetical protein
MFHFIIHKTAHLLLATALFIIFLPGRLTAGELSDQRAWIGLDLFPSILAADDSIAGKKCSDGVLQLLLVHTGRKGLAEEMAARLRRIKEIRGIPIRVSIVEIHELEKTADCQASGIFLTEQAGAGLEAVIRFGRERHAVVFSPFPGDVEKGITSGMMISDRILPYVNVEAMRLSDVHLKSFFLGIAKHYDGK